MTKLTKVMLLFGGESSEHTVSVASARNVYAALDEEKFDVILTYIDRTGRWWLLESFDQIMDMNGALELLPQLGSKSLIVAISGEKITPDVILPILHGENGEDGTIQGLAKLLHIPIVGCKVAASAICMDKVYTKQLLEYNAIQTVPYAVHLVDETQPSYEQLAEKLGEVMFVKPAGCGSSVGVSKVKNQFELEQALACAHEYDKKVLIEKAIKARELEVAMMGGEAKSRASAVGEIIPDSEFYDFESKYSTTSQSRVIIPADISEELSDEIRETALKAYRVVGGEGLSRIDFFLADDGTIYLNEINTLPGFTNISMYPKLWREQGMTYSQLIEELISLALRH